MPSDGNEGQPARSLTTTESLIEALHGLERIVRQRFEIRNDKAAELALTEAKGFINSTNWALNVKRGNIAAGLPKCNIFFGELLDRLGIAMPKSPNGAYWGTKNWFANREDPERLRCWTLTNSPQKGDAYLFSSGHMGFVSDPISRHGISALTPRVQDIQQWAFLNGEARGVYHSTPNDTPGLKSAPKVYFLQYNCPDLRIDPATTVLP